MPPNFRIDQPTGAGAGVSGVARDDLHENRQIELHDTGTGMSLSREWILDDVPPTAVASIGNSTGTPATITPPVMGRLGGTYKVTLRYDGESNQFLGDGSVNPNYALKNKTFVFRVLKNSAGVDIIDLLPLPAYLEEDDHSAGIIGQGPAGKGYAPLLVALRQRVLDVIDLAAALDAVLSTATETAAANSIVARDSDGDCEFRYVYADQLLAQATTNILFGCDAGGYITFWESVTEVARIYDNAGTRAFAFQGAAAAEVVSGGNLILSSASAAYVGLQEGATEVFRVSDAAGASTLNGRGSSTVISANTGNLDLTCAAASALRCFEGGTQTAELADVAGVATLTLTGASGGRLTSAGDTTINAGNTFKVLLTEAGVTVAEVYDAANVSTIAGKGSGGTRVAADTGNLTVDCASGSKVGLYEGGTKIAEFYDSAGTQKLDFPSNVIIDSTAGYVSFRATSGICVLEGTSFYANAGVHYFRSQAGTLWATIPASGVLVLPAVAAASVSSPAAGSFALFFDSSNSDKLSKKSSGGVVTVIGTEA